MNFQQTKKKCRADVFKGSPCCLISWVRVVVIFCGINNYFIKTHRKRCKPRNDQNVQVILCIISVHNAQLFEFLRAQSLTVQNTYAFSVCSFSAKNLSNNTSYTTILSKFGRWKGCWIDVVASYLAMYRDQLKNFTSAFPHGRGNAKQGLRLKCHKSVKKIQRENCN